MRGASRASLLLLRSIRNPESRMYHLSPHVYACTTGRYYMFLDLKRDAYFSIARDDMDELAPWVHGWHLSTGIEPQPHSPLPERAARLASELLAADVLRHGRSASPHWEGGTPAAEDDLASADPVAPKHGRSLFLQVLASLAYADWVLRHHSMVRIVENVTRRKRRRENSTASGDPGRFDELAAVFLRYRPWYPRDHVCLFDSLAMLRFLSRHGTFPEWVFGVREEPFSAHCWLQAGGRILNDHRDHVAIYTPILSV